MEGPGVDVLTDIVRRKRLEVAAAMAARPLPEVRAAAADAPPSRDFAGALLAPRRLTAVIAEVKRRSPSAGWIRPEYAGGSFSPEGIAARYHENGAAAISCLTDGPDFGGELAYIARIRGSIPLPVLRKDFIIAPYQVYEARAAGADAILLIAECLTDGELREFRDLGESLGMGVLIEAHDRTNFLRGVASVAGSWASTLFGVNNRDLRTLQVDLARTAAVVQGLNLGGRVVGESGIRTCEDLTRLRGAGVRIALVGEHLMRQADPGAALAELLNGPRPGKAE